MDVHPKSQKRILAEKCIAFPNDNDAFEELFRAVKPYAMCVFRCQSNIIPYYEVEDYLQDIRLVLWRVLQRVVEKPDIIESFSAYLNASIRNQYHTAFRDYVTTHFVERPHGEYKDSGLTRVSMQLYEGYISKVKSRVSEYQKEYYSRPEVKQRKIMIQHTYYLANKLKIIEQSELWHQEHKNRTKEISARYRESHREQLRQYGIEYYAKNKDATVQRTSSAAYKQKRKEKYQLKKASEILRYEEQLTNEGSIEMLSKNQTKIVTGIVRLTNEHLWNPASAINGNLQYGATLLILPSDKNTIDKIMAAVDNAFRLGLDVYGKRYPPKRAVDLPLRFGVFGSNDFYYLNVETKEKPNIVDTSVFPITDQRKVYNGCWVRASIVFEAFNDGTKNGVSAVLCSVQKSKDDKKETLTLATIT